MSNQAHNDLEKMITTAVSDAVLDPNVPAKAASIEPIKNSVVDKILPILLDITNNENWYKSKITWGLIVTGVSTILKPVFGEILDPDQAADIVNSLTTIGQFAGLALAWYGRWKAKVDISNVGK